MYERSFYSRVMAWRAALFFLVLTLIGGYALFEARRFLEGPVIALLTPVPGSVITDRLITLAANTKNVASIRVNGRDTYVTEDGLLQEHILLPKGYTVLTIAAEDRFGHETEKRLEFYTH